MNLLGESDIRPHPPAPFPRIERRGARPKRESSWTQSLALLVKWANSVGAIQESSLSGTAYPEFISAFSNAQRPSLKLKRPITGEGKHSCNWSNENQNCFKAEKLRSSYPVTF